MALKTKPNYSFKEIKDYLKTLPVIKFHELDEDYKLSELLSNVLRFNNSHRTVFIKNGDTQTTKARRRSIGDIYRIISYYYPKITITRIYESMLKLISENKALSAICQETGLRVYRATKDGESSFFNGEPTDEFGTDISKIQYFDQCQNKEDYWGYDYSSENINFIKI